MRIVAIDRGGDVPDRPSYEALDHTADIAVRCRGRTFAELVETAAFALFDQMLGDAGRVGTELRRTVEVEDAVDREALLVGVLSELHGLADAEGLVFGEFEAEELGEASCRVRAGGASYEPERHGGRVDVKAVTYHGLEVEETSEGWQATVVFDI